MQEVKNYPILDAISPRVHLKRQGSLYVGLCPFHAERTPSFTVTPSKGMFKCFGCGESGDAAAFLMKFEKVDFKNALRLLRIQADYIGDRGQAPEPQPIPIDYLPSEKMHASLTKIGRSKNAFWLFLSRVFGEAKANASFEKYNVGTSKHWKLETGELATVFWQVDIFGNVRQAKIMAYNPATGKRLKEHDRALRLTRTGDYLLDQSGQPKTAFAGRWILGKPEANLRQCFFGEHLLAADHLAGQKQVVFIVESEKTAIVCDLLLPEFIWLATGGASGCGFTSFDAVAALKGRDVHLLPDLGKFPDWKSKAAELSAAMPETRVFCRNILESKATENDRKQGFDLADYFLKTLTQSAVSTDNQPNTFWVDCVAAVLDAEKLTYSDAWKLHSSSTTMLDAAVRIDELTAFLNAATNADRFEAERVLDELKELAETLKSRFKTASSRGQPTSLLCR